MKANADRLLYHVYVLRSWRDGEASVGGGAVWRYSLEDPVTRQRRGFPDLKSLALFLAAEAELDVVQYVDQKDDQVRQQGG